MSGIYFNTGGNLTDDQMLLPALVPRDLRFCGSSLLRRGLLADSVSTCSVSSSFRFSFHQDENSWLGNGAEVDKSRSRLVCRRRWSAPGAARALAMLVLDSRERRRELHLRKQLRSDDLMTDEDRIISDGGAVGTGEGVMAERSKNSLFIPEVVLTLGVAKFLHFDRPTESMVYVFGGRSSKVLEPESYLASCEAFDLFRNEWVWLPPMSTRRVGSASAELGRFVYVIGGYARHPDKPLNTCEAFDTRTHTWRILPSMKHARFGHAVACAGNRYVYVFGGDCRRNLVTDVERYDSETDSWSVVSSLSVPVAGGRVLERKGKIYLIGGDIGTSPLAFSDSIRVFDTATHTWTVLGVKMTIGRSACAVAWLNESEMIIAGGYAASNDAFFELGTCEIVNVDDLTVRPANSLLEPRAGCRAVNCDGKIFLVGGESPGSLGGAGVGFGQSGNGFNQSGNNFNQSGNGRMLGLPYPQFDQMMQGVTHAGSSQASLSGSAPGVPGSGEGGALVPPAPTGQSGERRSLRIRLSSLVSAASNAVANSNSSNAGSNHTASGHAGDRTPVAGNTTGTTALVSSGSRPPMDATMTTTSNPAVPARTGLISGARPGSYALGYVHSSATVSLRPHGSTGLMNDGADRVDGVGSSHQGLRSMTGQSGVMPQVALSSQGSGANFSDLSGAIPTPFQGPNQPMPGTASLERKLHSTIEVYDPKSDTWRACSSPMVISRTASAVCSGSGFPRSFSGWDFDESPRLLGGRY